MTRKNKILTLLISLSLSAAFFHASGQDMDMGSLLLGGMGSKMKKKSGPSSQPTTVEADSMNIDIGNNLAVFTGNVIVDDEQMNIKCHKMSIYLEEKDSPGAPAAGTQPEGDSPQMSKELKKIVCLGNVILERKVADPEEAKKGRQKATAEKAEYDVKSGKITLTGGKPSITRGDDLLAGDRITIYRDNDKMEIESAPDSPHKARIVLTPDGAGGAVLAPAKKPDSDSGPKTVSDALKPDSSRSDK
jgi:lipopolysaccharide transport protein LptA